MGALKPNFVLGLTIINALTVNLRTKQVPNEALKQKVFHKHFCSDDHNRLDNYLD